MRANIYVELNYLNTTVMKDVTNEMVNPGNSLRHSTWLDRGSFQESVVHYISGIYDFDKFLEGVKWANTRFDLNIIAFKEYLQFQIVLKKEIIRKFTLENKCVVHITAEHNQMIDKSTKSSFSGGLSILNSAGVAGSIVAATIESISSIGADKIKTKSKQVKGSLYKLTVRNETGVDELIIIGVEGGHGTAGTNELFDFTFKSNLIKELTDLSKGKGCYIASVCYGDVKALQVIKFKQYRDETLSKRFWGRLFIYCYYSFSPSISQWLKDKKRLNMFLKRNVFDRIYNRIK